MEMTVLKHSGSNFGHLFLHPCANVGVVLIFKFYKLK